MTKEVALDSRDARKRLAARHVPYWRRVAKGIAIGYRKRPSRSEWYVRRFVGGKYIVKAVGSVDDHAGADRVTIFAWKDVLNLALDPDVAALTRGRRGGPTVAEAVARYIEQRSARSLSDRSVKGDKGRIEKFVLPDLGTRPVAELTTTELARWRDQLVAAALKKYDSETRTAKPPDAKAESPKPGTADDRDRRERQRRAQATVNRIWTVFRALLNSAFEEGNVASDTAWRIVKPYRNVDRPNTRFLSTAECKRFLNACAPDFRALARGALMTGLRLGELVALKVGDVRDGRVYVREAKSGKGRSVPLSAEGIEFFDSITAGRDGGARAFVRTDGGGWYKMNVSRRVAAAAKAAKIVPPPTFRTLRASYASLLINAGTDAEIIKELLGHSDLRMTLRSYAHLLDRTVMKAVKANLPKFGLDPSNVKPIERARARK
jgi:integrase